VVDNFDDLSAEDDRVKMRASMQTNDDAYTSESRIATSPTLSFTTGVIGANDDVLDMVPEAEGPWLPFGNVIVFEKCGGVEG